MEVMYVDTFGSDKYQNIPIKNTKDDKPILEH